MWISNLPPLLPVINSQQSSGAEILHFLIREMWYWGSRGEKTVIEWWKRRETTREGNSYAVKCLCFLREGAVRFMRPSELCRSVRRSPRWMRSAVPQDVAFRKPFFLPGGRPLPCLLCLQRGEGAGSASSLSQECSAIWEGSTWGRGTTSVTPYQPDKQ